MISAATVARKLILAHRQKAIADQVTANKISVEKELVRLNAAARAAPQDKQKQWDLANFYLKYNSLDRAADQLALIVHLDHNDLPAQMRLADVSLKVGAYSTAEFYYKSVVKHDIGNIEAWQGVASAYILERRFYEAMNIAEHTIEMDGTNPRSRLIGATALLNYALQFPDPLSHSDYVETARQQLAGLTTRMPDSAEVYYEYGRALVGLQLKKEAIVQLERSLKLNPDNGDAARLLAVAYDDVNQPDKALKIITEQLAREPNNPANNDMMGKQLIDSGKPGSLQQALEYFKKAAAKAPKDQYMNERLGEAYEKCNDLPDARKAFEKVTQINPNRSFAFQKLALIYTRLGEPALSRQAARYADHLAANEQQFKTMQELSAKHPENVQLHLAIADRFLRMKMYAPARDEYFEVLRLDPKNKQVPREFLRAASREIKEGLY